MKRAGDYRQASGAELAAALREGHPIEPSALAGRVYRGVSLNLPAFVDRIAWKTFAKVFHLDDARRCVRGWNLRLEQTGLDGPLIPLQRSGEDFHFGHFVVVPAAGRAMPRELPQALLLDYGRGGNPRFDPTNAVRDPLVAVEPGNADLLLGWTYLEIGALRFGTPSYFTLEAVASLTKVFAPPRAPRTD